MRNKSIIFIITGLLILSSCKSVIITAPVDFTNYEVEALNQGVDGTTLIKVYSYAPTVSDAIQRAKFDAVHAVLFKGIPGGDRAEPMVETNYNDHRDYFDAFFGLYKIKTTQQKIEAGKVELFDINQTFNAPYRQYVQISNDGSIDPADRLKVPNGYKVGVIVSVNKKELRRKLEKDGIIKGFNDVSAQAKQPVIMVVPADIYCNRHNFTMTFNDQGTEKVIPDYKKALQNDSHLRQVIARLNSMITDRGYSADKVRLLEAELKKIEQTSAELDALTGKTSGAGIKESPIDLLKRRAKADIIIEVDFELKRMGPKQYIHFNLTSSDAYTAGQIGGQSGDGIPTYASTATPGLLLEEALLTHMDNFLDQLQSYFDEMFTKGRTCNFRIQVWDNGGIDLEEEYDYEGEYQELVEIIDTWFYENSVSARYSKEDGSANFAVFTARVPLYDEKSRPVDAERFIRGLRSFLRREPFNQTCKVYTRGLGEAWLIIGEK